MTRRERDRLVVENDRLAGWYVRRFVPLPPGDPRRDDLVQAARLGLVEAARRYDPARGQFSSYAVWWMARFVGEARRASYVVRWRPSMRHAPAPALVDSESLETVATIDHDPAAAIDARRVYDLLPELSDRERSLIEQRWLTLSPVTLREVGEKLGCTREGARYIEDRAFSKLRHLLSLKLSRVARGRRRARAARSRSTRSRNVRLRPCH